MTEIEVWLAMGGVLLLFGVLALLVAPWGRLPFSLALAVLIVVACQRVEMAVECEAKGFRLSRFGGCVVK